MKIDTFFAELKRRNVYKVAIAYIVGGWALSQGVAQVFPVFDVPSSAIRAIVLLIILGLPVALVLAWMFELTPQGIRRTETADAMPAAAKPKKYVWIYVVVIGGAISIGLFFLGRYTASNSASAARTETATVPGKSIAVLPFKNLSDDKNTAYFSDGITEEILNALAQIPNLKVAARRSAFQFKGTDLDLRKIGQVLGVAHILEGSLQKAGDQVRINVQLVDVQNGLQAWSEKYDRKLDNVFAVEDEIAKAIATKLRVQLTGGAGQPLVVDSTNNPQAHELYLRGLTLLAARGPGLLEAKHSFQKAVDLDGDCNALFHLTLTPPRPTSRLGWRTFFGAAGLMPIRHSAAPSCWPPATLKRSINTHSFSPRLDSLKQACARSSALSSSIPYRLSLALFMPEPWLP